MLDKRELKVLVFLIGFFLFFYFFPLGNQIVKGITEGLFLLHEYAREHVVFCLIPAFFIAGAINTFLSKESVMKYLGPSAPKHLAYGIASVSGSILSVCSCTILPLFAGIYYRGAGLGPAITFLYSGPAINILAMVLTIKVLGLSLGIARIIGSVLGSFLLGVLMSLIFRKEEKIRLGELSISESKEQIPLYKRVFLLLTLIGILIFSTWGKGVGLWNLIYQIKWHLVIIFSLFFVIIICFWFKVSIKGILIVVFLTAITYLSFSNKELSFFIATLGLSFVLYRTEGEMQKWFLSTYFLIRQMIPLLFIGVFFAGFFLGRPGKEALIPSEYITSLVGGNSIFANLFASVMGAFMYFATITEIPILQGLLGAGMGKGPALTLLLAGPAVSLPSLIILKSILGLKKILVYFLLIVIISSLTGYLYGKFFS